MNHGEEVFAVELPAGDQPPVVVEPGKQPLDLPPPPVTTQSASVLRWGFAPVDAVRSHQLDPVAFPQALIQAVAVIGPVADQSRGDLGKEALLERGFDELRFMRRSAGDADGERKTMAVRDRHDFTAFSAARRADSRAPFGALEKLASRKVSDRSILPRSRKSSASAVSRRVSVPSRRHCWKRR